MHEKQMLMQEWICMKCPHTSNVESDQYFNSQHTSACWDMVARGIGREWIDLIGNPISARRLISGNNILPMEYV